MTSMTCNFHQSMSIVLLGILLWTGSFLIYIPQFLKIKQNDSHLGLDFVNLVAGCFVTNLLFLSYLLLEAKSNLACCPWLFWTSIHSSYQCIGASPVFFQLVIGLLCSNYTLYLFFLVFDYEASAEEELRRELQIGIIKSRCNLFLKYYIGASITSSIISFNLVFFYGIQSCVVEYFASGLAITASVLMCFHWIPQLVTTWRVGHAGSLSITTLILQMAGYVLAAFISYEDAPRDKFLWIPYIVVACIQCLLLCELTYLNKTNRRVSL